MKCPLLVLLHFTNIFIVFAKSSALRSKVVHCALVKKVEERTDYQVDIIIIVLITIIQNIIWNAIGLLITIEGVREPGEGEGRDGVKEGVGNEDCKGDEFEGGWGDGEGRGWGGWWEGRRQV